MENKKLKELVKLAQKSKSVREKALLQLEYIELSPKSLNEAEEEFVKKVKKKT